MSLKFKMVIIKCIQSVYTLFFYGETMIEYKDNPDFKKLKSYVIRLNTVVDELSVLEDFKDADYSEIATDIGYCTNLLEQRRERLQRRGRTQ